MLFSEIVAILYIPDIPVKKSQIHCQRTTSYRQIKQTIYPLNNERRITGNVLAKCKNIQDVLKTEGHGFES